MKIEERINKINNLKSNNAWGTYYLGQYYFTVKTNTTQKELNVNLENKGVLRTDIQRQLQNSNMPALFHEYVHYLHEITTVIGNISLGLDLVMKSDFSTLLENDSNTIIFKGYNNASDDFKERLDKILISQEFILGTSYVKVDKIISIKFEEDIFYAPYLMDFQEATLSIPIINYDDNGEMKTMKLGKFYLYEGLAYELDRIVDKQFNKRENINDYAKGTEYTVIREVSNHIVPNVDTQIYLTIASLSLSYINCGWVFIKYLERYKDYKKMGFLDIEIISVFKSEVISILNSKRKDFNEAQDEYLKIFEKRQQLYKAFQVITNLSKAGYHYRINNPSFEVDCVFEGKYSSLFDYIPTCDYMYLFKDKKDIMRDFLGTSIDMDDSHALKALISYSHFQDVHFYDSTEVVEADQEKEKKCPFYYCCDLELRKSHEKICKSTPWKIFEISYKNDKQYCWYGAGILELKGHNVV